MGDSKDESDVTLDSVHVDTLLKARKRYCDKATTTIQIFERNDFFYFFEKDGELAAQHTYGSVTAMKTMGKTEPANFCVMNHANFEAVLRHILLVRHLRVEIFKFVAAKGGKPAAYELEVRASPGNVSAIEHILYGENDTVRDCNYLAGIRVQPAQGNQISIGFSAVDTSLKIVQICDFVDNENLTNLESVLVQINPREVVLPQSDQSNLIKKVQQIIERNRILVTAKPTADFAKLSEAETARLFNPKSSLESLGTNELSSAAASSVFKYLGLLSNTEDEKAYRLEVLKPTEYMRIDQRTVGGLNLFEDDAGGLAGHGNSIFQILNKTRTPGGSRLLQTWIKQPLIQVDKINERLDLVEVFVQNTEARQSLYEDHLRKMPDFQRLATRFQSKKATLQDMYKVYVALTKLPALSSCLSSCSVEGPALQDNFLKDIQEVVTEFEKFSQLVETTLDLDQVRSGQFLIKAEFDEDLGELRQELDALEERIRRSLTTCAAELNLEPDKTLKLEHSAQHGHYFRLTMKEEKSVRNDRSLTILESNKSGVKFRNAKLDQLNDEHRDSARKYEVQQAAIVTEMLGIAASYADEMSHLGRIVSRLDVTVGLAVAALCAPTPYCRPVVLPSEEKVLSFTQLRHPIVELQETVASFIPNDVEFERDASTFHLVTGPNMGGKSTYIRAVGLAVLMAQIGSYVPAEAARLSVVDSVMVRIGASDCQVKGISTFMAEMLETSNILQNATNQSLILIDELGRGTSTYDGFGIAWAVSEHIAKNIGCFTLFTTHYTELTLLANEIPSVKNYHVTAMCEEEKLTLLYQVRPGVCDKSFGIHVAKIANFPEDVLDEAKERLSRLETEPMEVAG